MTVRHAAGCCRPLLAATGRRTSSHRCRRDRRATPRPVAAARSVRRGYAPALGVDGRRPTSTGRTGTAATLRAIDAEARRRVLRVPVEAETDADAADDAFASTGPVIDVQTHLVDPARWHGAGAEALAGFLRMVDPERWPRRGRPAPHRRRGVGEPRVRRQRDGDRAAHVDAGRGGAQRADERADRGHARDRRPLRGDRTRAHAHDRAPEPRARRARPHGRPGTTRCSPSGWKCYTLYGPPTAASPTGRLVPRRRRDRVPVPRTGPGASARVWWRRTRASAARCRRRRPRPRRRATSAPRPPRSPTCTSSCTTRATSATPTARRAPFDAATPRGRRPPGGEPRRRRRGAGRQRVRRARQHVVPDAAPPARGRARARQAARRGRARSHRVGHRLDLVRLAAAAHRRVPRVRRSPSGCRRSSAIPRSPPTEGADPRGERARRSTASPTTRSRARSATRSSAWLPELAASITAEVSRVSTR